MNQGFALQTKTRKKGRKGYAEFFGTVKPAQRVITTTQDAVWDFNRKERASAPERKAFTWRVNYCRDGSLPTGETE